MPPFPDIPIEEVRPHIVRRLHKSGSSVQADIYEVDWRGEKALLKDYSQRPMLTRKLWAPIFNGREFRALRRLQGVDGVPKLYGRVAPCGILMELLPAHRLPRNKDAPPSREFFARAGALVEALHARGIAHGDLRRKNILMDEAERPYLIDFETAVTAKEGPAGLFARMVFKRMAVVDRLKYARIKQEFYPDLLSADELRAIEDEPLMLRMGRSFKRNVLRYLRKPRYRKQLYRRIRRQTRRKLGLYR